MFQYHENWEPDDLAPENFATDLTFDEQVRALQTYDAYNQQQGLYSDKKFEGEIWNRAAQFYVMLAITTYKSYKNTTPTVNNSKNGFPTNRKALHDKLTGDGYTCKGTTQGGYVEYKNAGGTRVWIRPDGEVITVNKEWLPDGSMKVPVRYKWDGTPVEGGGHNTGEFVEPFNDATFLPPYK